MQPAALLSNTLFAAFFINLCLVQPSETATCDMRWIRLMYMLSCGKKKRQSVTTGNESFSEPLPTDTFAAIEYFKKRDPHNPLFNEDILLLNEILHENERLLRTDIFKYGRPHPKGVPWKRWKKPEENGRRESIFLDKLLRNLSGSGNRQVGIRGFPEQWNVNELMEMKTNKNYRRQIDQLLEQCCSTNPERICTEETFLGAC